MPCNGITLRPGQVWRNRRGDEVTLIERPAGRLNQWHLGAAVAWYIGNTSEWDYDNQIGVQESGLYAAGHRDSADLVELIRDVERCPVGSRWRCQNGAIRIVVESGNYMSFGPSIRTIDERGIDRGWRAADGRISWSPSDGEDSYLDFMERLDDVDLAAPAKTKTKDDGAKKRRAFAFQDLLAQRAAITCGFELETQKSNGLTAEGGEDGDGELDTDSAWSDASDNVANADLGEIENLLSSRELQNLRTWIRENTSAVEREQERLLDENPDDYSADKPWEEKVRELGGRKLEKSKLEIVADSSVQGFEFRTTGGLSYVEFMKAARAAFKLDHEIDVGCSFHIHLKVKDMDHVWSETFSRRLMSQLILRMDKMPTGVLDRLVSGQRSYYEFDPTKNAKYRAVHWHGQGTIEFRLFGNVASEADARHCLNIAIESLAAAYTPNCKTIDGDLNAAATNKAREVLDVRRSARRAA